MHVCISKCIRVYIHAVVSGQEDFPVKGHAQCAAFLRNVYLHTVLNDFT